MSIYIDFLTVSIFKKFVTLLFGFKEFFSFFMVLLEVLKVKVGDLIKIIMK